MICFCFPGHRFLAETRYVALLRAESPSNQQINVFSSKAISISSRQAHKNSIMVSSLCLGWKCLQDLEFLWEKSLDAKKSNCSFATGRNKVPLHTVTPQQGFGVLSSECFYYQPSDKEFRVCRTSDT